MAIFPGAATANTRLRAFFQGFRLAIFMGTVLCLFAPLMASAQPAPSAPSDALNAQEKQAMAERFEGDSNAPVTIVEYASLNCPHCAEFYNETMPQIEDKYVKTGKVRFVFRDFPLNGAALKAAVLARCLPRERYFAFIGILFKNQMNWGMTEDYAQPLLRLAQLAGLPQDQGEACMNDQKLLDAVSARRYAATKTDQVNATPTFILNDGADRIEGSLAFDAFSKRIDALLVAAAKK